MSFFVVNLFFYPVIPSFIPRKTIQFFLRILNLIAGSSGIIELFHFQLSVLNADCKSNCLGIFFSVSSNQ